MSTLAYTVADSATMVHRNLVRLQRYPTMIFSIIVMPVVVLLMMNYFFGGALGAALPGGSYIDYLTPGLLLFVPAFLTVSVSVAVNQDVTSGFINRLRSMATPPTAILTGHVVGAIIQGIIGLIVLLAAAFAMAFRPTAGLSDWLAALGLLLFMMVGMIWVAVAMGVIARSAESASNMPLPFLLLPYLGSGLVPTDSMPTGVRQFAEYQPFTPIANTIRGLLMGGDTGSWPWAVGWCAVFAIGGYVWAIRAFRRSVVS
ncbi:ABC transporter permease [Gordonia sp. CPCC 205515]|uniref:ABC transporter permease n=1 Tax=Gordonia sp. CPCC 205515 TaxID=3140791 RepID=UPI003AF3F10A